MGEEVNDLTNILSNPHIPNIILDTLINAGTTWQEGNNLLQESHFLDNASESENNASETENNASETENNASESRSNLSESSVSNEISISSRRRRIIRSPGTEDDSNPRRRLLERTLFENLVSRVMRPPLMVSGTSLTTSDIDIMDNIPSIFWEPIKIILSDSSFEKIDTIDKNQECQLCNTEQTLFIVLPCCYHSIYCRTCAKNWFNESVKCPLCRKDIRELLD